jgi:hypothetical protein
VSRKLAECFACAPSQYFEVKMIVVELTGGLVMHDGYPDAHEDDAKQAARAALEVIAAVAAVVTPTRLQTRVEKIFQSREVDLQICDKGDPQSSSTPR